MSYNPSQNQQTWQSQPTLHQTRGTEQHASSNQQEVFKPVLSQDEIRVLKECNAESFYYRCVPLSTIFSGLAYIAMKNGYLQKNATYGYVPKMLVGVLIGYIGGKISYQSVCAEKIMRLPNSNLGDALRKRKGQVSFHESVNDEPGFSVSSNLGSSKEATLLDDRRPDLSEHVDGIDSYNKVTQSLSPYTETDEEKQRKAYVTYDDLRKENREDYINKLAEKYRRQIPDSTENSTNDISLHREPVLGGWKSQNNSEYDPPQKPDIYFNPKKNKYGDVWDD